MRSEDHFRRIRSLSREKTGFPHRRRGKDRVPSAVVRARPSGLFRCPVVSPVRRCPGRPRVGGLDVPAGLRSRLPDPVRPGNGLHAGRNPGGSPRRSIRRARRDGLPFPYSVARSDHPHGAARTVPGPVRPRTGSCPPASGRARHGRKALDGVLPHPGRPAGRSGQTEVGISSPAWKVNRVRERLARIPRDIMFVSIEDPP